jgi:hypothetical protein
MEDRETPQIHKYGATKTTRIMIATVRHVTAWAGRTKYQATWFLLNRVYNRLIVGTSVDVEAFVLITQILSFSYYILLYFWKFFLPTSLKLSHFCYLGFNSQQGQKISSLLQNVQTSSKAHLTSNWMVLWDFYLGVKQPGWGWPLTSIRWWREWLELCIYSPFMPS